MKRPEYVSADLYDADKRTTDPEARELAARRWAPFISPTITRQRRAPAIRAAEAATVRLARQMLQARLERHNG